MNTVQSLTILLAFLATSVAAQQRQFDPPWNTPPEAGVQFTVPGIDNVPDIHGDITDPQLVIFMGGNQFMVVDDLLAEFRKQYPQYTRILVETLPPGILFQQIRKGSLVIGNMRLSYKPDVYTAGKKRLNENAELFSTIVPYSANKLALMVAKGNPKKITSLKQLAGRDIRISMPDKKIEGIGESIEESYRKAGGETLHKAIMQEKVKDSTTFVTQIHHRQSPLRILYGKSDVAPVWVTEILYQQRLGHAVEMVPIAEAHNKTSVSAAAVLKDAPHKKAAEEFVRFLDSREAKAVFRKYGFEEPPAE